jgi:hypothetical protein
MVKDKSRAELQSGDWLSYMAPLAADEAVLKPRVAQAARLRPPKDEVPAHSMDGCRATPASAAAAGIPRDQQ